MTGNRYSGIPDLWAGMWTLSVYDEDAEGDVFDRVLCGFPARDQAEEAYGNLKDALEECHAGLALWDPDDKLMVHPVKSCAHDGNKHTFSAYLRTLEDVAHKARRLADVEDEGDEVPDAPDRYEGWSDDLVEARKQLDDSLATLATLKEVTAGA